MPHDHLLHLHAQTGPHDDAWIVGNRIGLERLRTTIDHALSSADKAASMSSMTTDGEGNHTFVILNDAEWKADSWSLAALPYASPAEEYCGSGAAVHPAGLVTDETYKRLTDEAEAQASRDYAE